MVPIETKPIHAMKPSSSSSNTWSNSVQRESEQRDEQGLLDAATSQHWVDVEGGWDNGNDASIWSNQTSSQRVDQESSSACSTNYSSFQSTGGSSLRGDDGLSTSFSRLDVNRQLPLSSSLQTAARRDGHSYRYGASSSQKQTHSYNQHGLGLSSSESLASGAGSLPGIAPTFSGSTTGTQSLTNNNPTVKYQALQKSSLSIAASAGPPPGFLSPIETSKSMARHQTKRYDEYNNPGNYQGMRQRQPRGSRRQSGRGSGGRGRRDDNDYNYKFSQDEEGNAAVAALSLTMTPATKDELLWHNPSVTSSTSTPIMSGSIATERTHLTLLQEEDENNDLVPQDKKKEWLLRMNRRLIEIPVGQLETSTVPISAIMNTWAKTNSSQGASMVEMWLNRAQKEFLAGNTNIVPTTKMYTMAGTFMHEIMFMHLFNSLVDPITFARSPQSMLGLKVAKELLQRREQKTSYSICTLCTSRARTNAFDQQQAYSMRSLTLGPVAA